ncbi:MAG: M23 family metallopeptidase [Bacteroidetes bacterium]|nr:M23 family metallopeptidase [Bacteroidota bacterium]
MTKYLLFFSFIFLIQSCDTIQYRNSPYGKYRRSLQKENIPSEQVDKWTLIGEQTLLDSLFITAPLKLLGRINKGQINAWGYRIRLNSGVKLNLELTSNITREQLFLDFFFVEENGNLDYLGSLEDTTTFQYEVLETGDYHIRIQPALFQNAEFELKLSLKPIYETFPIKGKGSRAIGSFWGDPRDGGKRKHEGIDIFAPKNFLLLAVCDGEIDRVENGGIGGKTVWLYDPELKQSVYYAHLNEQLVKEGQRVKAGDLIGRVGNTGNAKTTPPHLHFGIYPDGMGAIDPLYFLQKQPSKIPNIQVDTSLIGQKKQVSSSSKISNSLIKKEAESILITPSATFTIIGAVKSYYHIKMENGITGFLSKEVELK